MPRKAGKRAAQEAALEEIGQVGNPRRQHDRFSLTSGTLCRFAAGSSPPRGRHPTPLRHHAGTTLRAPLSKAAWPISRDQAQAPTAFGIAAFKMCSDAGRGSRRRDLHPKGDVCAGHKLASDIRWLYLLLAACAPVHAPLTRGHRLPPGTSGPSGSPGGARP